MSGGGSGVYERLLRPLLFSVGPETAHDLAIASLRAASSVPAALRCVRGLQVPSKPQSLFGLTFRNPIGLAAGFDKNGVALPAWEALGFGFVEIGTVTAKAQPGNPKPRIFRFPDQQALINRLGFNNDGADAVAERLTRLRDRGRWPAIPVGINIGKSRVTPLDGARQDYAHSFRRVAPLADYVVLNVSSPNTPGLRSLQERDSLAGLLQTIGEENARQSSSKPILIKIAPDLSETELREMIEVCESNQVAGIIATNTTLDHSSITAAAGETGGLSGRPLEHKSTAVIRSIRGQTTLPIIGVGGVFDAHSAREKIEAGAQLLQIYTGYVYRGPELLRELVKAIG